MVRFPLTDMFDCQSPRLELWFYPLLILKIIIPDKENLVAPCGTLLHTCEMISTQISYVLYLHLLLWARHSTAMSARENSHQSKAPNFECVSAKLAFSPQEGGNKIDFGLGTRLDLIQLLHECWCERAASLIKSSWIGGVRERITYGTVSRLRG